MDAASHQAGEMGHIDQEQCSDLVRNLPHAGEVDDPGVGAASADNQLGLFALSNGFEMVVVDPLRLLIYAIKDHAVELAGEAELVPVGQVAAMGQIKTQDGVAGVDDRHVGGGIGLGTGVGLHVGVIGAKKLLGAIPGQVFDHIGKLAAAVVALARIAFGIFVGEDGTDSLQHRLADKILRGDHLQAFVLAADFVIDGRGDLWIGLGKRAAHAVRHVAILDYLRVRSAGWNLGREDSEPRLKPDGLILFEPLGLKAESRMNAGAPVISAFSKPKPSHTADLDR